MKPIDSIVADLQETALAIMREPHAEQTPLERADRLEISMRCFLACAVLKEVPYEDLMKMLIRYHPATTYHPPITPCS